MAVELNVPINLSASLGSVIINGYTIVLSSIEGGYKLTAHKGTDTQELEWHDGSKGDKGDTGKSIKSIVMNADYTLTIVLDDDTMYTTPSIRGEKGEDAAVTLENIRTALGYTPANDATTMVYKILTFDGTTFKDESGTALTFSQIKTLCLDNKHFVYCHYNNDLYIPQHIQPTQIYFDATYIRNHKAEIHRIGININGTVNQETVYVADSADIEDVNAEIGSLKTDLTSLRNELKRIGGRTDTPYQWDEYDDGYINASGIVVTPYANGRVSPFIPVVAGTEIVYKLVAIGNTKLIVFYSDDMSTIVDSVDTTGDSGAFSVQTGRAVIPVNAKYMRYYTRYYDETANVKYDSYINYAVEYPFEYIGYQWAGKKWIAFGTSITATNFFNSLTNEVTGKYAPMLSHMSGLILQNEGIAGGTIGKGGIWGGSGDILTRILSTDVSDADIITIEGFVNDFACGIAIGSLGDTSETTIMGCLKQAIDYIQTNSNAVVVLLGESTGKVYNNVDYSYTQHKVVPTYNLDTFQTTYNDAMRDFAHYVGCHYIDAGAKAQINCNHPDYLIDHIHHTQLGGKAYATVVWDELRNISCFVNN